jgi:hypothetical protein
MKSPLSRRFFVGIFEREEDILGATQAARSLGYTITDVYAPYAVHGLEKAMGLKRSKLPWVCFLLGLLGAALKVWFEFWTSAVDWPINVGGKPWNSLPAFVPVTFEVMVLFAGVSTVIAFLFVSRLLPGRKPAIQTVGITDHQFVIVLEETDAAFDIWQVRKLFQEFGAVHMEERQA